jgi:hypothetical protein
MKMKLKKQRFGSNEDIHNSTECDEDADAE